MKKAVVWLTVLCLLIGGTYGGFNYYQRNHATLTPVEVIPVSNIYTYNWQSGGSSYGNVSSGLTQSVFLQKDDAIQEIFVKEGQEVTVGTPLLAYDMTLLELQVE
jgi:multidrug efflux pump subunit AcrA (membrane-fusion protein)